jgi:hypothetical protein
LRGECVRGRAEKREARETRRDRKGGGGGIRVSIEAKLSG